MQEAPVITKAQLIKKRDHRTFFLLLKNGKRILGHLDKALVSSLPNLQVGDEVTIEMTPFDFDKGRIVSFSHPSS